MTEAEKKRRQRELKKKAGVKAAYFSISGDLVEKLDRVVELFELSGRAEAIRGLLAYPLSEALRGFDKFREEMEEAIESMNDISSEETRQWLTQLKHKCWQRIVNPGAFLNQDQNIGNEEGKE